MKHLPSLLLVAVVVTHYAYQPLAEFYADHEAAARAIFYILRGVEGTILYAVAWTLAPRGSKAYRIGVSIACAWGMLESAQTAICRAAMGIDARATASAYNGLCDVVTGIPVYSLTMLFALVIASFAQEANQSV